MEYIYNLEQLKEICAFWQNQLKLNNWRIAIGIERKTVFNNSQSTGEIDYVLPLGQAIIKVLDPLDYPDSPFKQDMEITLVHELLHLYFAPFAPLNNTLEHDLMENTIEQLANILVAIKKKEVILMDEEYSQFDEDYEYYITNNKLGSPRL